MIPGNAASASISGAGDAAVLSAISLSAAASGPASGPTLEVAMHSLRFTLRSIVLAIVASCSGLRLPPPLGGRSLSPWAPRRAVTRTEAASLS
jgi:hypothetical protein